MEKYCSKIGSIDYRLHSLQSLLHYSLLLGHGGLWQLKDTKEMFPCLGFI